ncbi:2-hydroxyacyl-CoA dehydratase [Shewanella yunxiaonensis]|uniref:2-hydroxyacyl-CoA dehydratase n=1 Tax=Shewanella yunxiaonensis TaxID=2829809 RepID=A0ABX7YWC5_9GAMM|nr:2-hydroxyacyl-CoA dehydratase family protein [Shewanella yunxiaonensis]QUN06989.1 2-hydroxyacyl-CoA dehydratase [Shewanella yunxiaonensis]
MNKIKPGLERFREYRDRIKSFIDGIKASPEPNPVLIKFFELIYENDCKTVDCIENDKPLLSSWYGNAPEIYAAMGLHYYCVVDNMLAHQAFTDDLEKTALTDIPTDMCSLIKVGAYAVENGLAPIPSAMIAMLEPCDAQSALHEAWLNSDDWAHIDTYALDPSYGSTDEDWSYFVKELKGLIAFLEQKFNLKLDVDRLREIVEVTNQQYEALAEYMEYRRALPCPHPSFMGSKLGWPITQHIAAGNPGTVEVFKMLSYDAEQKVKAGIGAVPNEKIRCAWTDLIPTWADEYAEFLATECNANIVTDFQCLTPYEHIDTSTLDTMLTGLAKRNLSEVPMIRQARGNIDIMLQDITQMVTEFNCNCVIFSGHVGHKDQSASIGFVKELCKDLGVPLLVLTVDNFDLSYTPMEVIKQKTLTFFNAHGLL